VILPLWLAILLTVRSFLRTSRAAGILLLPYLLWVSYAVALNIPIFILNR
jgi:tryptophan-rich sensory protein